jgi:hypothetical protein
MGLSIEPNADVFDETQALNSVGGDREFLGEIVGLVKAAWPTLLADIRGVWQWETSQPSRGPRALPKRRRGASRRVRLMSPPFNSRRSQPGEI